MYSLLTNVTTQFIDHLGVPIVGGKVYTYESGTTNPKVTYTGSDPTSTQNLNPIVLDDAGRANIYLGDGAYRIVVKDKNDALIADVNAISRGVNVTEFENFIQQVNDGLNELALVKQNIDTYVDQAIEAKKNVAGGVPGLDVNAQLDINVLPFGVATDLAAGIVKLINTLTSTATDSALTAAQGKVLYDKLFGIGQTWQNMTSSRALNTTYTNSTSKTIIACVTGYNSSGTAQSGTINGNSIQSFSGYSSGVTATVTLIIPPGGTYSASGALASWWELR